MKLQRLDPGFIGNIRQLIVDADTILDFFREQLVDKYRPALQKDEKGIFISSSDYAWTFVRMGSLEKALCGPVFAELKAMGLEPKELKFCK